MIIDRDVHMAAKAAALDDPPQVCSLQLTKQKRSDWARSYHNQVTQRVQAGTDQTRSVQCELWIQFGMPMWVQDEHVGYTRLEVSAAAEERSQHAHAEGGDQDVDERGDNDDEPLLTGSAWRSPRKSMQVRAFQAGQADEDEPRASQAPKPKTPKTQAADDTDAARWNEEDAEPSGSGNSSGLGSAEQDVGSGIEEEEEALKGVAVLFCVICCLPLRGLAFQFRPFAISALFSEA